MRKLPTISRRVTRIISATSSGTATMPLMTALEARACMGSIGKCCSTSLSNTLAHRLLSAGFELRLASSVALARTREALHNGWDKNDPKDAQSFHLLAR